MVPTKSNIVKVVTQSSYHEAIITFGIQSGDCDIHKDRVHPLFEARANLVVTYFIKQDFAILLLERPLQVSCCRAFFSDNLHSSWHSWN